MNLFFTRFDKDKELHKQRELFIECFPENIGSPVVSNKHYLWKFHSISDIGSYEYIAKQDSDILGYYAAIPYPYYVFGKNVRVAMVCDVMTGIKARGKGIFTKLSLYSINEFKKEGLSFSTGYPIRAEVIPGHRKAGWDFPFDIPMYGKFLSLNTYLKSKKISYLKFIANIFLKIYNVIIGLLSYKSRSEIQVERYTQKQLTEINGLNLFLSEWQKEQKIALIKNIDFLQWRLGAPEMKYNIIIIRKSKNIIGYAITRNIIKENVPCIGIIDFSLLNNNNQYSSILFREIEKIGKEKKTELILMMMMRKQAKKFKVFQNGFLKTPFKFSFIINHFDNSLNKLELLKENNWNLMWIDSDDL